MIAFQTCNIGLVHGIIFVVILFFAYTIIYQSYCPTTAWRLNPHTKSKPYDYISYDQLEACLYIYQCLIKRPPVSWFTIHISNVKGSHGGLKFSQVISQ